MNQKKRVVSPLFTLPEKVCLILAILLIPISFYYDQQILEWFINLRTPPLNTFMAFMTNRGLAIICAIFGIYLLAKKKYIEMALMFLTVAVSLEAGFVLKKIFQRERPYTSEMLKTVSIIQTIGFAFPSLHAAFCFSLWPFLKRVFKSWLPVIFGGIVIIIVVISRIYGGVHFMSDLLAGGVMGFLIAKTWIYLHEHHQITERFIRQVKDQFELRRQIGHLLTGMTIALLIKYHLLTQEILLGILIVGGLLSVASRKHKIPIIYQILRFFERPNEIKRFPGKGSFFLVLGSFLSVLLFPKDIALAAIAIMAVGDAVTTIIGTYFGYVKNPLNPQKHLEGTFVAIILSTLAAFTFVSFEKAFLASVTGMLIESFTVRFLDKAIDDNVLIPLVAGATLVWLS